MPPRKAEDIAEDCLPRGNLGRGATARRQNDSASLSKAGSFNSQSAHARFIRVSGLWGSMRRPARSASAASAGRSRAESAFPRLM